MTAEEPDEVEFQGEHIALEPYVQKWPRLVSIEEWLALAHSNVLPLPWIADDGSEVCSFAVLPLTESANILVVLYDAHGREVIRTGDYAAIEATVLALEVAPNELTFLPAPRRG